MNTKHTPGPWFVGEVNRKKQRAEINTDARDSRLGYTSWTGLARVYGCDVNKRVGTEIMEANARLIAAAPELLMALQLALPALEYLRKQFPRSEHDDSIDALAITKYAIAKATGEPQ